MEEVQIENRDGDRDPLLILGKIEDMMLYAYPVLNAYPKYERFVLAADIFQLTPSRRATANLDKFFF